MSRCKHTRVQALEQFHATQGYDLEDGVLQYMWPGDPMPTGEWNLKCLDCSQTYTVGPKRRRRVPQWVRDAIDLCTVSNT
jgi:hypothetical protein